jgi:micrococcal nuclease
MPRPVPLAWILVVLLAVVGCAAAPAASPRPSPPPAAPRETPAGTSAAAPWLGGDLVPRGPLEAARVLRVIDGDTIVVDRGRGPERVRYIGIDAPETVDPARPVEPMGPEASRANAALVAAKTVYLEKDVSETDRYSRLLRYVWLKDPTQPTGWLLVNLVLVAAGYAQVATYPPDVRYAHLFRVAQQEARASRRGLWAPSPSNGTPRALLSRQPPLGDGVKGREGWWWPPGPTPPVGRPLPGVG